MNSLRIDGLGLGSELPVPEVPAVSETDFGVENAYVSHGNVRKRTLQLTRCKFGQLFG